MREKGATIEYDFKQISKADRAGKNEAQVGEETKKGRERTHSLRNGLYLAKLSSPTETKFNRVRGDRNPSSPTKRSVLSRGGIPARRNEIDKFT